MTQVMAAQHIFNAFCNAGKGQKNKFRVCNKAIFTNESVFIYKLGIHYERMYKLSYYTP